MPNNRNTLEYGHIVIHDCRLCAELCQKEMRKGKLSLVQTCHKDKAKSPDTRCFGECKDFYPNQDRIKIDHTLMVWDWNRHQYKYKYLTKA